MPPTTPGLTRYHRRVPANKHCLAYEFLCVCVCVCVGGAGEAHTPYFHLTARRTIGCVDRILPRIHKPYTVKKAYRTVVCDEELQKYPEFLPV